MVFERRFIAKFESAEALNHQCLKNQHIFVTSTSTDHGCNGDDDNRQGK
jgi:hypothetical protein